jgi:Prokaryotic membrane lipoprotein lipid attachment site
MKKTQISLAVAAALLSACNSQTKTETTTTDTTKIATVAADITSASTDGKFCFLKTENRDSTIITLNIANGKVTGEMTWNPYQQDGAVGTLTGTKNANGEFDLVYDYMIEGNHQTEDKVMKIENDKLLIKQGELIDPKNDGNMKFKDLGKAVFSEILTKINCK